MIKTANQKKERKLRTRQDRPTNKQIIAELGIEQWKFYTLKKKGVFTNDNTVEEIRDAIKAYDEGKWSPTEPAKQKALYGKTEQTVRLIISGIPTESLAQLLVELQGMKHFEISSVKVEFE